MKLTSAEIVNYRSIRAVTIEFDPMCRVLVGINESGKSNLLKALSFLQSDRNPNRKDDVRENLPDEDIITQAYVRFYIRLEKAETNKLNTLVRSKILSPTDDPIIVQGPSGELTLSQFCAQRDDVRYFVDLTKETKEFRAVIFPSATTLSGNWRKPDPSCPSDFEFSYKEKSVKLSEVGLLDCSEELNIPEKYLADAGIEDLSNIVLSISRSIAQECDIKALFWEYDEKYLLPPQISIDAFASNPDTCVPLKNMFLLAGVTNIGPTLEAIKTLSLNQSQNFFDRIASRTTTHFRSVWKEYQSVEFRLRLDADKIVPGIKEKNSFDLSKRSDGFKRFVSFLLMISVSVKTDSLKNTLLLIDETDSGLHPSGARYLRDELIRISTKNYVVYSTHSVFMIDTGNIGRHYIVTKENEITDIVLAEDSNVADEEVLYNALGFSLFEILKKRNIIFEGWRDKKLYQVAFEAASPATRETLKDVGLCHAKGAKHIKALTPMIELANRTCLILSDSDSPAREQQALFRKEKGFGEWKTYQEVIPTLSAITGEDFVKSAFIVQKVNELMEGAGFPAFTDGDCPDWNRMHAINTWLRDQGMTEQQAKENISRLKGLIFDVLSPDDIQDGYFNFLDGVANILTLAADVP